MGASDNYSGITTQSNSGGTMGGFTMSTPNGLDPELAKQLGLPATNNVSIQNPGQVDLSQTNPALWNQINQLQNYQNDFRNNQMKQVMDPNRYNDLRDEMAQRQSVQMNNNFSHMGLAGSSANIGGLAENGRQLDFQMRDRQLGEQLRALQMEQSLSGQITGDTLQGQNQYGNFQQSYLNLIMGKQASQQAQEAANAQMWGGVLQGTLGAAGTVAGAVLGGPAGAMAGATAGSSVGAGANSAIQSGSPAPSAGGYNSVDYNSGYAGGGADYGYNKYFG